ncbi:MAG: hypothetical protein B7733_23210 [Myxococcales bacterium FL481]|nr:MAG: hypothetical protein B7733_23210 [Myxococcales bacterium FL481]
MPLRSLVWLACVAMFVTLAAVRTYRLDADPPRHVVEGYKDRAHLRDEGAKLHEARNRVVFGSWRLAEADEYAFWLRQSPLWVGGAAVWLDAVGLSWPRARWISVTYSLATLALLAWLAWVRHGPAAAFTGAICLGLCWPYLLYSRLALMECAVLFWLVTVGACLLRLSEATSRRAPIWVASAVICSLAAVLTKQSGWLVVPASLTAMLGMVWRARGPVRRWGVVGAGVVIAVGVALALDTDYSQRLAFNARHYMAKRTGSPLEAAWDRLWSGSGWTQLAVMVISMAPFLFVPALVELAWRLRDRLTAQSTADWFERWWLMWLCLGTAVTFVTTQRAVRFQLIVIVPAAWFTAALFGRLWRLSRTGRSRVVLRSSVLAVLAWAAVAGLMPWVRWIERADTTLVAAGPQLEKIIGPGPAVVVGEHAGNVVFTTPYKHFYIRPRQFNDDRQTIDALGVTHVVTRRRRDFVERVLRKETPKRWAARKRLGRLKFRGETLTVWKLAAQ